MTRFAPIRSALALSALSLALSSGAAVAADRAYAEDEPAPRPVDDGGEVTLKCGTSNVIAYQNRSRKTVTVRIDFDTECTGGGGLDVYNRDGTSDSLVYLTVEGDSTAIADIAPGSYIMAACGISDGDDDCCTLEITELGVVGR